MNPKIQAPAGAVAFRLARVVQRTGKNRETGRKWNAPTLERLYGDPDASGELAEIWPIEVFSTAHIVERWGPGKYNVTWLGSGGERVASKSFVLTAPPATARAAAASGSLRPRRTRSSSSAESDAGDARAARNDFGELSSFEMLQMMDQRATAAAERERASTQAIFGMLAGVLGPLVNQAHAPAAAAPSVDLGRELGLIRREMQLTMREQMAGLEQRITGMLPDLEAPADDDLPPPKDLQEATEQVGISLLREVTSSAPEIVHDLLPTFFKFLRSKGVKPSADVMRKARDLQRMQTRAAAAGHGQAARTAAGLRGAYSRMNPEPEPDDTEDPDDVDDEADEHAQQ